MGLLEIILLGVGLAMDCFAVSLSKGIAAGRLYMGRVLLMALFFGLFQAGMPLIGYFAGVHFAGIISKVAPWIALGLLGYIGGKMIYEHFHEDKEQEQDHHNADYSISTILILSVATSIDALATGLLFIGQQDILWLAVLMIGFFSFIFSLTASLIGVYAGRKFNFPAELLGGVILVGIGLKIWLEAMLS